MASRVPDHITLSTEERSSTSSTPEEKDCTCVDMDSYPYIYSPEFIGRARKDGGGTGYVRIYDVENTQELALIEVTSATYVMIDSALTNYATSGKVCIEMQIYTDGTGTMYTKGGALQVN